MASPTLTRRVRSVIACAALAVALIGGGGYALGQAPQPAAPRDPSAELAALSAAGFAGDALAWESLAGATRAFAEVDARYARYIDAAPGHEPRSVIDVLFTGALRGPVWPDGAGSRVEAAVLEELTAAGLFGALDAAATATALGRPASEFAVSSTQEWARPIQGIASVLVAEIRRAAHVADDGRLAVSVRRVLALARLLEREPDSTTNLVGTAIRDTALREIRRVATEYRLGEGVLRSIASEVDRLGAFDGSAKLTAQPDALLRDSFDYEATRLVLAIAIYESQNVLPPDSLADLDPDDVTPFPRDPWNGETWVYGRYTIADRPSRYERFKLYGLGPNHTDDGCAGDDMKIIQARPPFE